MFLLKILLDSGDYHLDVSEDSKDGNDEINHRENNLDYRLKY